jgi:pyruvate,water dikinase
MTIVVTPELVPLDQLASLDPQQVGGKAFNCARLMRAGFPVPDGLVVLASATETDLQNLTSHPWFDRLPADALFAVRSSGIGEDGAEQSFAGIHETRLNVGRGEVPEAVRTCRASARSPQALDYRRAKGLPTGEIRIAVLIQRMIRASAAGVAFTVNPLTGSPDEIVINSSWGLGEALVSGRIEPDEFGVLKSSGDVLWQRTGRKGDVDADRPSLSSAQLRELAPLLDSVERHYGAPQDVEWCLEDGRFWIVQSRPVTTARPAAAETEWTRANFAEVLPDITSPQALSVFETIMNRAERGNMGGLLAPEETLGPVVKSFGGRLYFNLSQLRYACVAGGVAPAAMLRSLGHAGRIEPEDEKAAPRSIVKVLRHLPDVFRLLWMHARVKAIVERHEKTTEERLKFLWSIEWDRLPDAEMWPILERWVDEAPELMQVVLLLGGVLFPEELLRAICKTVGFPFERLLYPQLAVGRRSVSAQQAFDLLTLVKLARRDPAVVRCLTADGVGLADLRKELGGTVFLAEFERFLDRYGHRGRHESDWALARYREDPGDILLALRAHVQDDQDVDPFETIARQEQAAAEAWTTFEDKLTPWQRWTLLPLARKLVHRIKQYYIWREQVRSDLIRELAELRKGHLVLAARFVDRGWLDAIDEYFLVRVEEIGAVVGGRSEPGVLREIAVRRAAELDRYRSIRMPLLMRESELPQLIRAAEMSGAPTHQGELTGHPVSGGTIEAEVVVLHGPGDFGRMKRGAILVAEATDPSWTPLFTLASGVIVEVGGILSHASTIAREYGLPAIANVRHATKRLRTGERVRLDAVRGVIHRLAE